MIPHSFKKYSSCSCELKSSYQQGNILLISLALLGALSIFGVSSMTGALTEERISINIQDRLLAIDGAESALRSGESALVSFPPSTDVAYYDTLGNEAGGPPNAVAWGAAFSYNTDAGDWAGAETAQPQYKLEAFSSPNKDLEVGDGETEASKRVRSTTYYRILGAGNGLSSTSTAVLESIIIRQ